MLRPGEILIHDGNAHQFVQDPIVDGETKSRGLVPRNWGTHPCGSIPGAPKAVRPKYPRSEWSQRIADKVANHSLLSDIRMTGAFAKMIPSRDQNGRGYCWAHSTVSAAILARARDNQPYVDLSAYAIACIIKGFRDEGGWNGESMTFLKTRGCPTSTTWPQQGTSRSYDNQATWAEADKYKDTEWDDIEEGDFDMQISYALDDIPFPLDLNWWSHSICGCDPVDGMTTFKVLRADSGKLVDLPEFNRIWRVDEFGAGAYGLRIWNSWGDSWSDNGMGVLTESKARNNGAIALRVMRAAA